MTSDLRTWIVVAAFLLQALAVVWRGGQIEERVRQVEKRLERIERVEDNRRSAPRLPTPGPASIRLSL